MTRVEWVWRVATSTWFLGVALFVLTWPVPSLVPTTGLDFSFVAGLHMAAHEHLKFGTEIVATYGPLGFLRYPFLYYAATAALALLYTGVVHLLLCLTLVWALRRTLPILFAFAIAWVVVSIIGTEPESALVVVIVWLIEYLRSGSSPLLKRAFPVLAGLVAGLEVLIKLNTGVTIAILGAIAILIGSRRRWQPLAQFVGSFLLAFLVAWFASGQGLGNVGAYVSTSRELIGGWSTAMEYPGANYQLWGALVAAIAVLVVAWQSSVLERLGRRVGMLLIWLVLGFSVFKEGFVNQQPGHEIIYFATALGAAAAFSWRRVQRTSMLWSVTLIVVLGFAVTQSDPGHLIEPGANASALADQFKTMVSADKRHRLMLAARTAINTAYGVDPEMIQELQGHTDDVIPSEQSILWANNLKWDPTPVYELYYAVDSPLDDLNADVLASSHGPERLLRTMSGSVNNRSPLFDSPAAQRSMLCHYVALSSNAAYQVLARVPNRCGDPRLVESVRAPWEQFVERPTPRPGSLLFVEIDGAAPHGWESLRTLFWRAYVRAIGLKQGTGPVRDYWIVPTTTADGLLMSVPPAADFPGVFPLDPAATQLTLGVGTTSRSLLTYKFYEETITPARTALARAGP
jgi:hypothetical protein